MSVAKLAGARGVTHGVGLLAIAYLGFISLGLPDAAAGVAWPSVRERFTLAQSSFGMIFLALGCGYCLSGFFGGKLTHALGLGNLLWISSGLVAAAMLASGAAPAWIVMVAAAVIWGLGSGGIDAGLNAYVASHFPARHVNWLHACYSLGATMGPLVMTLMVVQFHSWRLGYTVVGSVMLAMAMLFLATRQRWSEPAAGAAQDGQRIGLRAALRSSLVWLQIVMFFVYVGLEFTVGQWSYTLLTESRGVSPKVAGILAALYFGAIGVGRVISGTIANRMGLDGLVRVSLVILVVGAACVAVPWPLEVGFAGLALMGLGLAPVFPCLMAQTPHRLGAGYAAHAVGFQVSAGMAGAALVPSAAGLVAQSLGLEAIASMAIVLAILLAATHEVLLLAGRRRG